MEKRVAFETFKSSVCHKVKELGDIDFVISVLETRAIDRYWELRWYPEA